MHRIWCDKCWIIQYVFFFEWIKMYTLKKLKIKHAWALPKIDYSTWECSWLALDRWWNMKWCPECLHTSQYSIYSTHYKHTCHVFQFLLWPPRDDISLILLCMAAFQAKFAFWCRCWYRWWCTVMMTFQWELLANFFPHHYAAVINQLPGNCNVYKNINLNLTHYYVTASVF